VTTLKTAAVVLAAALIATACGGGGAAQADTPLPTPTPVRPTLGGSPLDVNSASDGDSNGLTTNVSTEAVTTSQVNPDAVDCSIHAEDPSICRPAVNDLESIRFDDALWSFEQSGFPVYTNINSPFPIFDVIDATIGAARAELAGQNQALFPHLSNRRTAAPYTDIGIWSVTFLFAEDPTTTPAQVQVAIEATTKDGETVEELVTYLWQWTSERWVPEWERLEPADSRPELPPISDSGFGETPSGSDQTPSGSEEAPSGFGENPSEPVEESQPLPPPSGSTWCPPGFPYGHTNGLCYANPINPRDQISGPGPTIPNDIVPGAPYASPSE